MSMRVISWEEYTGRRREEPSASLAVTAGVFDGVHAGHQSLIRRVCASPYISTVVTFRENPVKILRPQVFSGDILSLEQKLHTLEVLGIQLTVLIDFSGQFSKINGRDFIELLFNCRPVQLVAVGWNFRCGYQLSVGAEDIRSLAEARGLEVWVAPPVMDTGQPVSSSRIRRALAAGDRAEAERLLAWPAGVTGPVNGNFIGE